MGAGDLLFVFFMMLIIGVCGILDFIISDVLPIIFFFFSIFLFVCLIMFVLSIISRDTTDNTNRNRITDDLKKKRNSKLSGFILYGGLFLLVVAIGISFAIVGAKNQDADDKDLQFSVEQNEEEMNTPYLDASPIIKSDSYQGNEGDSFVDIIGRNYNTRGNTSIDGTTYTHGIEAWIARWNEIKEISWAYAVFKLEPGYRSLSGRVTLIESYNTDNFDTTLYFYDGDRQIDSFWLSPQSIPFEFSIDISDVEELKILVEDNEAVEGGTSFGIVDAVLSSEEEK